MKKRWDMQQLSQFLSFDKLYCRGNFHTVEKMMLINFDTSVSHTFQKITSN